MERAEPELSFSSWCSSTASPSTSEATQGPSEEVEEAASSSQTVTIAIRCQPILLLHKQHHKHRKRPEPPPVRSLS